MSILQRIIMEKKNKYNNVTITLTAGEQSENHVGMQKYGDGVAEEGFTLSELKKIKQKFEAIGCECIYKKLNSYLTDAEKKDTEDAAVLIIRKGIDQLLSHGSMILEDKQKPTSDDMFQEHVDLNWDRKYYDTRRSKVLNKHARYNLCYAETGHKPDYENKKGRVVSYDDIPITKYVLKKFEKYFGDKGSDIQLEGNKYYDITKCGIGYHGDGERKIVIGMRLGASIPLHYHWFHKGSPIGPTIKFNIHGGDIYIMSEKATGYDWKSRNIKTLRHAAGAPKYLKLPE